MFTSIFSDLKAFYAARHEPENMRLLAEVYWRLLLSIGLLLVVAVLMYGTWEFIGVISNLSADDPAKTPSSAAVLDRNKLQNTLSAAHARQQSANTSQNTTISDPSK